MISSVATQITGIVERVMGRAEGLSNDAMAATRPAYGELARLHNLKRIVLDVKKSGADTEEAETQSLLSTLSDSVEASLQSAELAAGSITAPTDDVAGLSQSLQAELTGILDRKGGDSVSAALHMANAAELDAGEQVKEKLAALYRQIDVSGYKEKLQKSVDGVLVESKILDSVLSRLKSGPIDLGSPVAERPYSELGELEARAKALRASAYTQMRSTLGRKKAEILKVTSEAKQLTDQLVSSVRAAVNNMAKTTATRMRDSATASVLGIFKEGLFDDVIEPLGSGRMEQIAQRYMSGPEAQQFVENSDRAWLAASITPPSGEPAFATMSAMGLDFVDIRDYDPDPNA